MSEPCQSRAPLGEPWVAGADGCRRGWIVVLWHPATNTVRRRVVVYLDDLLAVPEAPAMLGLDMVIGCPDRAQKGGRRCDRQARQILGHPRSASVFSPPAYPTLEADTYAQAQRLNHGTSPEAPGLSKQAFHLIPKLRAVAEQMNPRLQDRVREVHPELAFCAMNGGTAVEASKHSDEGEMTRIELLGTHGFPDLHDVVDSEAGPGVEGNDLLDAHAACWTARRIYEGTAQRCPPRDVNAPRNGRGLRMEIWR